MYKGFKIIPFIPAGREKTLRVVTTSLLRFKDHPVDQVYLWENTKDKSDLKYIDSLANDFFKVFPFPDDRTWKEPKQLNTGMFYRYTQDPKTIYIRFDDDIVFIDDDYFKNILDFRIAYAAYLTVFGNIWNNSTVSYLQQKAGHIGDKEGIVKSEYCMDEIGWRSPRFAQYIHEILLGKIYNNKTADLFLPDYPLKIAQRFSVSNFAFFGGDIPEIPDEEETWITEINPRNKVKQNIICGSALCCHFTFYLQREHIFKNTNFLDQYLDIAQKRLSENYYKLLEK